MLSPCCLDEQSTDTACLCKIFTYSVLAQNKGHYLSLSYVYHSNKPNDSQVLWRNCSFLTISRRPHHTHNTHTQVSCRESSISRTSIWFMALAVLKVGGEKQVSQQEQPVTPPCLQQGVSFCCIPPYTYMHVPTHKRTHPPLPSFPSFPSLHLFQCSLCTAFSCSSCSPISICHLRFSLIIFSLHLLTNFQSFFN